MLFEPRFYCAVNFQLKRLIDLCYHGYVTWHLPSMQMSIEPGLHGVPSITLAASFAEKRYWESFGLQNREHGWPKQEFAIIRKHLFLHSV